LIPSDRHTPGQRFNPHQRDPPARVIESACEPVNRAVSAANARGLRIGGRQETFADLLQPLDVGTGNVLPVDRLLKKIRGWPSAALADARMDVEELEHASPGVKFVVTRRTASSPLNSLMIS
jgi:hypothetical protein